MKLGIKLNLITITFTIVSCLAVIILLNQTSLQNYKEVERQVFKHSLSNYFKVIEDDLDSLNMKLVDWAHWNATYDFIDGKQDDYIEENIPNTAYEDYALDYVAIFDENMNLLYGGHYIEEEEILEPLPDNLIEIFKQQIGHTGLLSVDHEIIIYSSEQITDNMGTVVPKGLFVFAYQMDAEKIKSLEDSLGMPLEIYSGESINDFEGGMEVIIPSFESQYGMQALLNQTDDEFSVGGIVVPLLNSDQEVWIIGQLENRIRQLGKVHNEERVLLILVTMGFFGILISLAVRYMIINRVVGLNEQVDKITDLKSTEGRVSIKGKDELGELTYSINQMLDEINKMHQEVSWLAYHDELTGAYNRRAGLNLLESYIQGFEEKESYLTISYIDIDGLKKVNDILGHTEGDRLITDVVGLLVESLGDAGKIIRMGGDEFLIVFKDMDQNTVIEIMLGIQEQIKTGNKEKQRKYDAGFSFGVAQYDKAADIDIDIFIEQADKKMYQSRVTNRKRLIVEKDSKTTI